MKMLFSSVTALGMIGTVAMVTPDRDAVPDGDKAAALAALEVGETPGGVAFLMVRGTASCAVSKGKAISANTSELDLGDDCGNVLPALSKARYWREGPRGTVAFAAAEGDAILEFAEGDGVAYETFRRGSPLIALIAPD